MQQRVVWMARVNQLAVSRVIDSRRGSAVSTKISDSCPAACKTRWIPAPRDRWHRRNQCRQNLMDSRTLGLSQAPGRPRRDPTEQRGGGAERTGNSEERSRSGGGQSRRGTGNETGPLRAGTVIQERATDRQQRCKRVGLPGEPIALATFITRERLNEAAAGRL